MDVLAGVHAENVRGGPMLKRLLLILERRYLSVNGWRPSSIGGLEPCWSSPRGVSVVNTPLGAVICMQYDAVRYQRLLDLGMIRMAAHEAEE